MHISIFAKKKAWHINQLLMAAKKKNIKTTLIHIKSLEKADRTIEILGDVVIWRSSFLNSVDEKLFQTSINSIPLINSSHIKYPLLARKIFQQKHLEKYKTIPCIPTYSFNAFSELQESIGKGLTFPFIQKPDIGSQGVGISLIRSMKDVKNDTSVKNFIFQPFIENDGDYRVLILGGKVLGIIKRTAKKGNFLNNISQGGAAEEITDKKIVQPLSEIALKVASAFNLSFCGIDIIFSQKDSCYYFLELNTLPQWKGFQKATGINVAEKIMDHCLQMATRKKSNTLSSVKNYFEDNYDYLDNKKFHYSSRLFLWTKKGLYKKRLDELKNSYIGKDDIELDNIFLKILQPKKINTASMIKGGLRGPYLKKYPELGSYNEVLFKSVFAETIYKKNIRPLLGGRLDKDALLKFKDALEKNKKDLATLSTYAVNFIYNLSHYLEDPKLINPQLFLTVAKDTYVGKLQNCNDLRLYLLTHAIIGESKFYSRKITRHRKIYLEMIRLCEDIILKNYFSVPLDNKFEFLVCAKLLDFESVAKKLILDEADRSLSAVGNFLVSRLGDSKTDLGQDIIAAEHRNVLFLMSSMERHEKNLPRLPL